MKAVLTVLAFLSVASAVSAIPRVFAPVFLKAGALNETYVWDERSVGPFTVELRRPGAEKPLSVVKGFPVDRPLSVLGAGNKPLKWSAALVAPDAFDAPGPVVLRFLGPDGSLWAEVGSEIRTRSFPSEDIPLDQTMSELRSKPNKRKDKEAAEIWKIYLTFDPTVSWQGGRFLLPLTGAPTSAQFGDIRHYLYAGGDTSRDYHRGTDFAVPTGTPVLAPARGRVVLTADRMLTGRTVVLEHAPGVFSVYFHLSQIAVKTGQAVVPGARLGLSGATGLVTGPHLHWEVRIGGVSVDALDLVTDGLLDTTTVSAVISSVERPIH